MDKQLWTDCDDISIQVDLNAKNRLKKFKTIDTVAIIDGKTYQEKLKEQHNQIYKKNKDFYSWADSELRAKPTNALENLLQTSSIFSNDKPSGNSNKINLTQLDDLNIENSHK